MVIKVGQQHLYDIDVIGEPKPTNEWTVEGKVSVRGGGVGWSEAQWKLSRFKAFSLLVVCRTVRVGR